MAEPITIVPYDAEWPAIFTQERSALQSSLGSLPAEIRHVGSTAVPGLAAKPIVDILLGLAPDHDLNECVPLIQKLGYEYISVYEAGRDGMPFRRYFRKRQPGPFGSFNLHAVHHSSNFWWRHLAFCEHLRERPEVARDYEQLKSALAPRFSDVNDYARAKTDFIEGVLRSLDVHPQLRRIRPTDDAILRDVRLAALKEAPDAFAANLTETEAWPAGRWQERAERNAAGDDAITLFAEENAAACGMVGGQRSRSDPSAAMLVAMWVSPNHRRRGIGKLLVNGVISWAESARYSIVQLWVTDSNAAAKTLYESAGFEATSTTQRLPSNPNLSERMYVRRLRNASPTT